MLAKHAEVSCERKVSKALAASKERRNEEVTLACTKGHILLENSKTHLA